ncbi:unnamed protein product [Urochloa humidicola]
MGRLCLLLLPLCLLPLLTSDHGAVLAVDEFTYNGFGGANLSLDGMSVVAPNGLLVLSNGTSQMAGHAFHPTPVRLRDGPGAAVRSFSAAFVFAIVSNFTVLSDNGLAFVVAPSTRLSTFNAGQYLGVLNVTDNGKDGNRVLFVELDTMLNPEFQDMNSNHVGVNVNSMRSLQNHNQTCSIGIRILVIARTTRGAAGVGNRWSTGPTHRRDKALYFSYRDDVRSAIFAFLVNLNVFFPNLNSCFGSIELFYKSNLHMHTPCTNYNELCS